MSREVIIASLLSGLVVGVLSVMAQWFLWKKEQKDKYRQGIVERQTAVYSDVAEKGARFFSAFLDLGFAFVQSHPEPATPLQEERETMTEQLVEIVESIRIELKEWTETWQSRYVPILEKNPVEGFDLSLVYPMFPIVFKNVLPCGRREVIPRSFEHFKELCSSLGIIEPAYELALKADTVFFGSLLVFFERFSEFSEAITQEGLLVVDDAIIREFYEVATYVLSFFAGSTIEGKEFGRKMVDLLDLMRRGLGVEKLADLETMLRIYGYDIRARSKNTTR